MKIKLLIGTLFLSILFLAGCSTKEAEVATYVGLRINPEVGFLVDLKGEVTDVIPLNQDGDVVLSGVDVIGMSISDASIEIVDEAVEAGYIDVEATDNEVFVEVIGDDEEVINYQEKLRNRINNFFVNKGIYGKVSEETKEEYLEAAFELGISVGHTKMVMLALEFNPDYSLEELKDMEIRDLVKLTHNGLKGNKDVNNKFEEGFKVRKEELKEEFSEMEVLRDQIREIKMTLERFENYDEFVGKINLKISHLEIVLAEFESGLAELELAYETKLNELNSKKELVAELYVSMEDTNLTETEVTAISEQIAVLEAEIEYEEESLLERLEVINEKTSKIEEISLEIAYLNEMLTPLSLTESEVLELKEDLAILKGELAALRYAYMDAIKEAKDEMKEAREAFKEEARAKNEERKAENQNRVKEHIEEFKNRKSEFKSKVEEFQKGR